MKARILFFLITMVIGCGTKESSRIDPKEDPKIDPIGPNIDPNLDKYLQYERKWGMIERDLIHSDDIEVGEVQSFGTKLDIMDNNRVVQSFMIWERRLSGMELSWFSRIGQMTNAKNTVEITWNEFLCQSKDYFKLFKPRDFVIDVQIADFDKDKFEAETKYIGHTKDERLFLSNYNGTLDLSDCRFARDEPPINRDECFYMVTIPYDPISCSKVGLVLQKFNETLVKYHENKSM